MQKYDLIIVGAGAAGMLAAIQANAEAPQLRIALLERLPRPGKKLPATAAATLPTPPLHVNIITTLPGRTLPLCSRPCKNIPNKIIWLSSEAWAC